MCGKIRKDGQDACLGMNMVLIHTLKDGEVHESKTEKMI